MSIDQNKNEIALPIGAEVLSAKKGQGSFLTFDLRDVDNFPCSKEKPDFMLWVYLVDWEIYEEGTRLLDCDVIDEKSYYEVLQKFNGIKLVRVDIDVDESSIQFVFEGNMLIILEADLESYTSEDELFMLFDYGQDTVVSFSPDRGIYCESSKQRTS